MMTLRERALSVLNHRTPDIVPWLGDLAYWVTWLNRADLMPDKYKGDGLYRLHRDLGVGFYLQGYFPFKEIHDGVDISDEETNGRRVTRVHTPYGDIQETHVYLPESYTSARTEHFVKSWRDFAPLRYLYEHTFTSRTTSWRRGATTWWATTGWCCATCPKAPSWSWWR